MMRFKVWGYVLLWCSLAIAITACNKSTIDLPAAAAPTGQLDFYNLIPSVNANSIDFYINGTRQNTNKIPFGFSSGYMGVTSGQQSIVFKFDTLNRAPLFDPLLVTIPADISSIFVASAGANGLIFTRDTTSADFVNRRPQVRFVHAEADGPAYDLLMNSVSIANKPYKTVSGYTRADSGTVVLKVNLAGTNTTVQSRTLALSPAGIYTVYVYGSATNSTIGINLGVITN